MIKEIENKIGQLQYEISCLGLDKEDLTGVSIRTEELKDLVKKLTIPVVVGQSEQLVSPDCKDGRDPFDPNWICPECRQKAKEYAKFIYDEGYNNPIYNPDIMQTMKDFEAGFKAALSFCNDG